ncbi:hypothetical protein QQP08_014714 [Theobroma cacao]|nr:hypothetical protein QQP08_014714 [Theobroma cacao]
MFSLDLSMCSFSHGSLTTTYPQFLQPNQPRAHHDAKGEVKSMFGVGLERGGGTKRPFYRDYLAIWDTV